MVYHKNKSFAVADMPGLIEGAHEGKGLGHTFLKHIERTRVLVHIVDPDGFDSVNAIDSIKAIADELKQFNVKISKKPKIIAVNKSDLPSAEKAFKKIKAKYKKLPVFLMCAATGQGTSAVLDEIVRLLNKLPVEEPKEEEKKIITHRIDPIFTIERAPKGAIKVAGKEIERIVQMTNFSQEEAVIRLKNYFKTIGLDKALKRHGIVEGESVVILGKEFEWSFGDYYGSRPRSVSRRKRNP